MNKWMIVDVESSGLSWFDDKLHGVGVQYLEMGSEPGLPIYHPVWNIPEQVRKDLADPAISKIGHNFHGFDAKFLQKAGFDVKGEFDDTMVIWNLISEESLGLKYLAEKHIGEQSLERKRRLDRYMSLHGARHIGELCAKDLLDDRHPHAEIIADYCCEDVVNTGILFQKGMQKLVGIDEILKGEKFGFKKSPLDYYFEEARPLERVLFEIEYRGIRVDIDAVKAARTEAVQKMNDIVAKLNKILVNRIAKVEQLLYKAEIADLKDPKAIAKRIPGQGACKFSWSNSNHVGTLFFEHCDLDLKYRKLTKKGKIKTDKDTLTELRETLPEGHRLIPLLQLYSDYQLQGKIANTYTGTAKKGILSRIRYVDGTPRIFPKYRQTTGTGRLACENPNMQNLKRDAEVKRFFIPDTADEVFDDADYSQIELRTGADLSHDPGLVGAYNNGEDVHLRTASRLFKRNITKQDDLERQAGKRTNFLAIFRGQAFRLKTSLKADTGKDFSIEECDAFLKTFFAEYKGVDEYLNTQLKFFQKYKFCITKTGRIRRLPDIDLGRQIQWVKQGYRSVPKFIGSGETRLQLIESIREKNGNRPVSQADIGYAALKRYNHAVKAGYNQPIQGLAASLTKRAMIQLHNAGHKITNQVHDSLVIARPKNRPDLTVDIIRTMENIYPLSVPVTVDHKTLLSMHPKHRYNEDSKE